MSAIKSLVGQTLWYGLSNIGAKLLNYILTPLITYLLSTNAGKADFGDFSVLYACISVANIIYTYGMETAFFRFSSLGVEKQKLFRTTGSSLLLSTLILSILLIACRGPISKFIEIANHPEYINWCVYIIAIDTLAAIPFAMLRQEGRPRKYAFTKMSGIVINIFLTVFFIAYSPDYVMRHPDSAYAQWYGRYNNTGFLILANLAQSLFTFLLLFKEWKGFRWQLDKELWLRIMKYSWPMVIVGLGGMINETMDRFFLLKFYNGTETAAKEAVAVYSANYRISIFISMFIQAFRMAGEPFFFKQAQDKNAPATYARVMKWFVIILCFAFLTIALYLDIWQYFIGPAYRSGLGVVPVLLLANVFLGIYYNLSVWYKISDKMHIGMYITLFGASLTMLINFALIPVFGMYACAWATLTCYASMVAVTYVLGQKHYPVPYNTRKLLSYLGLVILLFAVQRALEMISGFVLWHLFTASVLTLAFAWVIYKVEYKYLKTFPVIGRLIKQ